MSRKELTFEERVEKYYQGYLRLRQYRDKLDAGTIDHAFLRKQAEARAIQAIHDEQTIANRKSVNEEEDLEDDARFRESRLDEYEAAAEWDEAGDKALLSSLIELEVQHRVIKRDLSRATSLNDKEKYWKALRENSIAQRDLQIVLGIDKKTREQARASGNPMDNWQQIKDEIGEWADMLVDEFAQEAEQTKTVQELKDLMKIKLSWPLAVIDSVVYNLDRVKELEKE